MKITKIGGASLKVGELRGVVCFELEAFAEPKALSQTELAELLKVHGSIRALAAYLETAFSGVQERLRPTRRWDPKKKAFVKLKSAWKTRRSL